MKGEDDDFAFEPIPGLPELLPPGENMLWQGSPKGWSLAVSAFHVRKVILYFAVLLAWRLATAQGADATASALLFESVRLFLVASAAVAILCGLAFLYARGTIYTLTTKRLVIRSGLALPVTLNLPLALIESAAVKHGRGAGGSIALTVQRPNRIAYAALWPNVRPWRVNHPQPLLRGLGNVEAPARHLARALFDSLSGQALQAGAPPTVAAPGPAGRDVPAGRGEDRGSAPRQLPGALQAPGGRQMAV